VNPDSKISSDIKTVSLGYDRSVSEKIGKPVNIINKSAEEPVVSSETPLQIDSTKDKTKSIPKQSSQSLASSSIVTEFVQGLLEELLSSDNRLLKDVKFYSPKTIVPGSISIKRLANSFCQANGARNRSITAKRAEITAWHLFSEGFEDKVVELRTKDKKLADKTARSQIYAEMKPYLTGIFNRYLHVMICKARKINKLFGYECTLKL
jgi:hypothetical protein